MRRFAFVSLILCLLVSMILIVSVSAAPAARSTRTPMRTKTRTSTSVRTLTPTPTPTVTRTPTPAQNVVTGSVVVAGGACCVGGTAGSTININAAFSAASSAGAVTQMRVTSLYGGGCVSQISSAWEPFVASKSFPVAVVINWVGFYVSAQYLDAAGNLSPVYCDDISVEGMPAPPTPTSTAIPGADFVGSPLSGSAPLTVQFTHINSSVLSSCTWTFGDGASQTYAPGGTFPTCPSASHTYAAAGSYTVSLSVLKTTGQGNSMSKLDYIQVSNPVTATPRPGCGTVVVVTSTPSPTYTPTPRTATATATTCGPIYVTPTRTSTPTP